MTIRRIIVRVRRSSGNEEGLEDNSYEMDKMHH